MNSSIKTRIECYVQNFVHEFKKLNETVSSSNEVPLGTDLGGGWSGICLLLAELDQIYPNEGWDRIAHNYLLEIITQLKITENRSASLWGGTSGVCLAVLALSRNKTRYQNLLNGLHNQLVPMIRRQYQFSSTSISNNLSVTNYDVIYGLTGIGRYLLLNKEIPVFKELLQNILHYLIRLSHDREIEGRLMPGWYISKEGLLLESEREQFPFGVIDIGLSHGITGPLILLSLCKKNQIIVEGIDTAISKIANQVIAWGVKDSYGWVWPGRLGYDKLSKRYSEQPKNFSESWCYGILGIARSLWLAGDAMNNSEWKRIALDTFIQTADRARNELYKIISPTYCHGFAGVLHLTNVMLNDTKAPELIIFKEELINLVLSHINHDFKYGIPDIELNQGDKVYANNAGLLKGAAGVMLVLLNELKKSTTPWECAFMLK